MIEPSMGWFPAWWLDVKTPFGDIEMLNVHLRPPVVKDDGVGFMAHAIFFTPLNRRLEMEFLYTMLDPRRMAIVAGDFNEGDFGAAATFLRERGFHDALLETKTPYYTFEFALGPVRLLAKRYDRIYYTYPLHACRVQVLHEGMSDHFPVIADFKKHAIRRYRQNKHV